MDQTRRRPVLRFPLCLGFSGGWKLWLLLFLPQTSCIDREASTVQKVAGEQFAALLCTNATKQNDTTGVISVITCSIRTQSREECRMGYYHGRGFDHDCGSRFRLIAENQTVFLRVTSLTTEDSGNYSCYCSHPIGTNHSQYNITVEALEDEDNNSSSNSPTDVSLLILVWIVLTVLIVTGVIVGHVRWMASHRDCWSSAAFGTSVYKVCSSLDPDDPEDRTASSTVIYGHKSPLIST